MTTRWLMGSIMSWMIVGCSGENPDVTPSPGTTDSPNPEASPTPQPTKALELMPWLVVGEGYYSRDLDEDSIVVGDFECDGTPNDVAIGDPYAFSRGGGVFIFYGGRDFSDVLTPDDADVTIYGQDAVEVIMIGSVMAVGRADGDGCDDLFLGRAEVESSSQIFIMHGPLRYDDVIFIGREPAIYFTPEIDPTSWSSSYQFFIGDLNGDMYDDVLSKSYSQFIITYGPFDALSGFYQPSNYLPFPGPSDQDYDNPGLAVWQQQIVWIDPLVTPEGWAQPAGGIYLVDPETGAAELRLIGEYPEELGYITPLFPLGDSLFIGSLLWQDRGRVIELTADGRQHQIIGASDAVFGRSLFATTDWLVVGDSVSDANQNGAAYIFDRQRQNASIEDAAYQAVCPATDVNKRCGTSVTLLPAFREGDELNLLLNYTHPFGEGYPWGMFYASVNPTP